MTILEDILGKRKVEDKQTEEESTPNDFRTILTELTRIVGPSKAIDVIAYLYNKPIIQDSGQSEELGKAYAAFSSLKPLIGKKKAVEVISNYSVEDLMEADRIIEAMDYPNTPEEPKGRLGLAIRLLHMFAEKGGKFKNTVVNMSTYWGKIGRSFDDFLEIYSLVPALEPEPFDMWYSYRDTILDVSCRAILPKYGIDVEGEIPADAVVGMVSGHGWRYLPKTTNKEFLEAIINAKKTNKSDEMNYKTYILEGFDDWRVALEFATGKKGGFGNYGEKYRLLGLSSMEGIRSIEPDVLDEVFTLYREHTEFLGNYVKGDLNKFHELLAKSKIEDADQYMAAVGNNVVEFNYLMDLAPEKRPSYGAIEYVRENYHIADIKDAVMTATTIDTKRTGLFSEKTSTPEELLELSKQYDEAVQYLLSKAEVDGIFLEPRKFIGLMNDHRTDPSVLPDLRFFTKFYLSENGIKQAKEISDHFTFDEYDSIGKDYETFREGAVKDTLNALKEVGYDREEMILILKDTCYDQFSEVRNAAKQLDKVKIPAQNFLDLFDKSDDDRLQAIAYIRTGLFGDGKGVLPIASIPSLEDNGITPTSVKSYLREVSLADYWRQDTQGKDSFNLIGFVKDYKALHPGKKD